MLATFAWYERVWLTFMIFVTQNGVITSLLCAQSRMRQIISKYTCEPCQECIQSINRNKHRDLPSPTMTWHKQLSELSSVATSSRTRSMFLHGLAEIQRVDKQQAQNDVQKCLWLYKLERRAQQRRFIFRKHLSVVRFVNTFFCQQCRQFWQNLPSASRFIYSLWLLLLFFLRNILIFWQQFYR